jgi:4'-phosphopantetheinyl transferase
LESDGHGQHVALWLVALDGIGEAEQTACAQAMALDERLRRDRIKAPGARLQYVVSRALLRTALSRYADVEPGAWRFDVNAYGKPAVAGPRIERDLRFNLSHTDGLVGLAITEGQEIGLDIEATRRDVEALELARGAFAPQEIHALERLPAESRRARFFDIWVLKEAYAKARGLGVSLPFDSFAFDLDDPARDIGFSAAGDDAASGWGFARMAPTADHVLAMATRCDRLVVETRWIDVTDLCAATATRPLP